MGIYCFHVKAEPLPDSEHAADIGGAFVNIWVMDESIEHARMKADAYLAQYGWVPLDYEYSLEPTLEQISKLDQPEHQNYEAGKRNGISAVFSAWPKETRPEGVIELRSMTPRIPIGKPGHS